MDYEEWTPIGRGDPLKNDPTFDYSPPMVGKVKYWINPLHRTPDPPIVPNKETSTEFARYTSTVTNSVKSSADAKQPSEIKRIYQDYKDVSPDQMTNSKFNYKVHRPQQFQYQNHYYSPTRQPPPPLPMLSPPPIEPNSYTSTKIENSTILELSWDVKSHPTVDATTNLRTSSTAVPSTTTPSTKITFISTKETKPDDKSVLQSLLGKEKSGVSYLTNPTTVSPLTPHPVPFTLKLNSTTSRLSTHSIFQGHSKVKKYGGTGKSERSSVLRVQGVQNHDLMLS